MKRLRKYFERRRQKVVTCGIAAWQNKDKKGGYLTVEISPPYKRPATQTPEPDILDEMFGNDDDQRKIKMRCLVKK